MTGEVTCQPVDEICGVIPTSIYDTTIVSQPVASSSTTSSTTSSSSSSSSWVTWDDGNNNSDNQKDDSNNNNSNDSNNNANDSNDKQTTDVRTTTEMDLTCGSANSASQCFQNTLVTDALANAFDKAANLTPGTSTVWSMTAV